MKVNWLVSENNLELYSQYDKHRWHKWVSLQLGCSRAGPSTIVYRGRINTDKLQPTLLTHVEQETNFQVRLMAKGQIQIQQRPDKTFFRPVNGLLFDIDDWSLQHVKVPIDGGRFFAKLITHRAKTCGDGSYKHEKSTGAFLGFTPTNMDIGINAACQVHIHPKDNNAYCRELGEIQSAVAYVNSICKQHKITDGTVTHGIDNDMALMNYFGPYEPST